MEIVGWGQFNQTKLTKPTYSKSYVKVSGDSKGLSFCPKKLILRLWAAQNRPPSNQIPDIESPPFDWGSPKLTETVTTAVNVTGTRVPLTLISQIFSSDRSSLRYSVP